jgi:hypothetical protein
MEKWIFEIPDFETGPIGHSGTSPGSFPAGTDDESAPPIRSLKESRPRRLGLCADAAYDGFYAKAAFPERHGIPRGTLSPHPSGAWQRQRRFF